ncbi:MAG TPA: hypothetical protein ENL20_10200, partial [Candidatus Cloacimonetes bacterium]|nr:hypothetical protein [Candidatus Cloacimonadota bacterium]
MKLKKKNTLILLVLLGFVLSLNGQFNSSDETDLLYHVSLVGAVPNPGVYFVPPSTRVSEIIKLALTAQKNFNTKIKNKQNIENSAEDLDIFKKRYEEYFTEDREEPWPEMSKRLITIKRHKQEILVDLVKFYTFGDSNENPYVMDGDIIHIPAVQNKVTISGAVQKEGNYEIVEGDKILDVGCGIGKQTVEYSKEVGGRGVVIGLDISKEIVKE